METKNIQEFLVLAQLGSSYAAAEKLFISQSTLVRHMQAIEDEFGTPLFDRTRRGFALNAAGQVFLPYAQKMALLQSQCYQALHPKKQEPDVIRLAAVGKIVDLIIDFKKEYPGYNIDYQKSEGIEKELRCGGIEIAFLSTLSSSMEDLTAVPFYRETVYAVIREDHPLAARDSVRLEELRDENFVALCEDVVFDDTFLELYRKVGFAQKISMSVPAGTDLMRAVREGLGIALIHGNAEKAPEYPGLKVIPVAPRIEYEVSMCWRSDVPLTKAAECFVNFAKAWRAHNKQVNLSFDCDV